MPINIKGNIKILGSCLMLKARSIYLFFDNIWNDDILWKDTLIFSKD